MNSILVVTSDEGLHSRISRAVVDSGEVTRLAPGDALPRPVGRSTPFIVLDVRGRERGSVLADLASYRRDAGQHARCVAIARVADAVSIEIVTTLGQEVVAAIFPEIESVEHLIRAHLHDSSRSTAGASALHVALRLLPAPTHETLRVVLGGGLRVSLVKQLAAYHQRDRTSIGKALSRLTDWTPQGIIDVAKASYATMLLRQTDLSFLAIAGAVGFNKQEALGELLRRTFDLPAVRVRDSEPRFGASDWLEHELGNFLRRRGWGGGASNGAS